MPGSCRYCRTDWSSSSGARTGKKAKLEAKGEEKRRESNADEVMRIRCWSDSGTLSSKAPCLRAGPSLPGQGLLGFRLSGLGPAQLGWGWAHTGLPPCVGLRGSLLWSLDWSSWAF